MAERQSPAIGGGSLIGVIANLGIKAIVSVAMLVNKAWHGLTSDGTLAAAFRQGADEVASALKAFPDAIQARETGTILSPTPGEVASARQHRPGGLGRSSYSSFSTFSPPHPWPSEIASQNRQQPQSVQGHDHGHDAGHSL